MLNSLILKIKLLYYTILDYFDNDVAVDLSTITVIERKKSNSKLTKGVRRLVQRLRGMSPDERTAHENLLCQEPYKKTAQEKLEELRVRDKLNKNPTLKTEDDLVNKVVKEAPRYQLERDLSETRKAMTACLRAAGKDPTNPSHTDEMKALKAKYDRLRADIERMKNG